MNKRNRLSFLAGIFFLCAAGSSRADIRLPAVISSNMVLQQQSRVAIWGWSNPGEKIFITTSWSTISDSATATRDAKWKINIKTPSAGGPYTITIKGNNTIVLQNVMIGEVWICSGQSNMEWSSLNGIQQINDELPTSANSQIRFFHIPKTTALYPQEDCKASWTECNAETLKGFSAVAYFFGKQLQQKLKVPIGLINASWGGTPAEVWVPEDVIEEDPELKSAAAKITEYPWWPHLPGRTYNAMIAPLTSMEIAGAIWYQGESNTSTASTYKDLMVTLIDSWRKAWNKNLPFYYVQIAPFAYGNHHVGALLREAQSKTQTHPNTGMVVITDLVDDVKDIHPGNKRDVGNRLADWALAETYRKQGIVYKSPSFRKMTIDKNKVTVYFDNVPTELVIKGNNKKATEFYIAGGDHNFLPAEVRIEGNHVILTNKQIKNPVAVRFAFSNTAIANIFSKEGLPVDPFRTDNWEVDTSKISP